MIYFYFYVHWCFTCMNFCVIVPGPLELELQTVVSHLPGSEKETEVLWENNQCPKLMFHLP